MRNIKDLQITIVSSDSFACRKLQELFSKHPEIEVCHTDIRRYCYENRGEFDCLVSPANAFGFMTGGYDAALSDILGWDFQKKVQAYIQEHFYGEQGVGTSAHLGVNRDISTSSYRRWSSGVVKTRSGPSQPEPVVPTLKANPLNET